jgi:NAD(P)-dependent dehydrogenase (short-subunit alcohol dehydrogenase family)
MTDHPPAHYPSLSGVPVLVTGGASGIGEGIVRAFAAQGARVGFIDIAEAAGKALATSLAGGGAPVRFARADVTDTEALRTAIRDIEAANGPTLVLVNNAANDDRHDWRDVTPDYWDGRIAVNLRHAFFAIQAVAPGMIAAGGGAIVNLGSISWMLGDGGYPAYTSSKSAMQGLTRSFARDLGPHRIRVNCVSPGWVMTERQRSLWLTEEGEREMERGQCLPGRLQPDDIARMVLFLASEEARMITAQDFIVDAGWA